MLLRLMADWMYDAKNCRKNLNSCKQAFQKSKEYTRDCFQAAERCSDITDTFLLLGESEMALDSLKMWEANIQYAKEAQERNNIYIGIILQYESWLSKCS